MRLEIPIGAASLVVGLAAGYAFAKRSLEQSYQDMLGSDIADMRKHYQERDEESMVELLDMRRAYEVARKQAEDASAALASYKTIQSAAESEDPVLNLLHPNMQLDTPLPDPELKSKPRHGSYVDRNKSYVISVEDYMANEKEFPQLTITYYAGDDTLANDDDEIMDGATRMLWVGEHLNSFGAMSNDPNIVYIRNLPLKFDLEVIRSDGKYSVEVAGLGGDE